MDSLIALFDCLEDPRVDRTKEYPLQEIMFLILCGCLCGVQSWRQMQDFGEDRIEWLRKYLPYNSGVPSHQTLGRVMSLLKPDSVVKSFAQFMSAIFECNEEEIIALDGKTLRRSFDRASGQQPIHILNAWAVNAGVSLGQLRVDEKTNEIKAVPEILELIDIRHAVVTTDALNTQKNIAEKIIEKGAQYVLPVKGNHKNLEEDIRETFDTTKVDFNNVDEFFETIEKGHGRIETRSFRVLPADTIEQRSQWRGLTHIGMATNETLAGDKSSSESRIYLLSFGDPKKFAQASRGHWAVESSLHWVLDVTFDEDGCRVRKDHAPENFSSIRKMALNILRADKDSKLSIPRRQGRAARKTEYLDSLLSKVKAV